MKMITIRPGVPWPGERGSLVGTVIPRDLLVGGHRWSKGRRLSAADVEALLAGPVLRSSPWNAEAAAGDPPAVTLLVAGPDDIHEDEAACRLAAAVGGPGLVAREPAESRVDLVANASGVVVVRTAVLERLNRIDGLSVFSVLDGQVVEAGALVASAKTGPHLVADASVRRAEAITARAGRPVIDAWPFVARRIGAVVKETLAPVARARFETTFQEKVAATGSTVSDVRFIADDVDSVADAFRGLLVGSWASDIIVTAGAAMTDPSDAVFGALGRIGGRVVSHGAPAHPGSMIWLGRARRTTFLGLPSCGAFSKATAADLLLPWLVAGLPPSRATVARLGHGGVLGREMRFRLPAYARGDDPRPAREP